MADCEVPEGIRVCPGEWTFGQPVFSEQTTRIEIEDESAGEFVKVSQERGHTDIAKWITIYPSEWPTLRESIDYMTGQCRSE